jgi:hypothetical protein
MHLPLIEDYICCLLQAREFLWLMNGSHGKLWIFASLSVYQL